jgi:hypothetical protein
VFPRSSAIRNRPTSNEPAAITAAVEEADFAAVEIPPPPPPDPAVVLALVPPVVEAVMVGSEVDMLGILALGILGALMLGLEIVGIV